jgi:hypothetical protein
MDLSLYLWHGVAPVRLLFWQGEDMKEPARKARNAQRLSECFATFAERIKDVIADMEKLGFRPRIQDAHRTIEDQLKAFNNGFSDVKFGFHNVTGDNGKPESLAVDLLEDDHPLSPTRKYIITLAHIAQKHQLHSGIFFRLKTAPEREALQNAIDKLDFNPKIRIGFDPTHLEPAGMTIAQAKAGQRPT